MKKWKLFYLVMLGSVLALGQLERVAINSRVAFYIHDVLIVGWLVIGLMGGGWRKIREWWGERKLLFKRRGVGLLLGLGLVAVIGLGWLTAVGQGNFAWAAILYTGRYVVYLLFTLSLVIWRPLEVREWRIVLMVFMVLVIGLGFGQYWFWSDTRDLLWLGFDDHYLRMIGAVLDPNFLGIALGLMLIWLVWELRREGRGCLRQLGKIVLAGAMFLGLILTYSRSAYLVFLTGIGLSFGWWWLEERGKFLGENEKKIKRRKKLGWLRGVGVVVGIVGLIVVILMPKSRNDDSVNLLRTNSISVRLIEAREMLGSFSWQNWVVGRGLFVAPKYEKNWWSEEELRELEEEELDLVFLTQGRKVTAKFGDNFFLGQLSFFGVGGGIIVGYFYFKLGERWWRKRMGLMLVLVISWLVGAQFVNAFYEPMLVVMMGLVVGSEEDEWRDK